MYYEKELHYFLKVIKRMHLQSLWIQPDTVPSDHMDFVLHRFFGLEAFINDVFRCPNQWSKDNTVYKLTDRFLCNYIYFLLPETSTPSAILIGPYISFQKTKEDILEEAERHGIPATQFSRLEACYSGITLLSDDTLLFTLINVLGETLWGTKNAFEFLDLDNSFSDSVTPIVTDVVADTPKDLLFHMRNLETRYAYENEMMNLVSLGLSRRTELMLRSFSQHTIEQRTADPVRNLKNYAIISNTLMRKAAERGGVHPVYLDRTSSVFAKRVETITDFSTASSLLIDMARSYCRLVRKHASNNYSPFIQKTVTYIDANISGDLSLRTLAALQNLNASYLSALFHKETGKTVTDYVNARRMDSAAKLLRTTQLQIQTIAGHCGMNDSNYFSKTFKKYYGVSPLQFREQNNHPSLPGNTSENNKKDRS